MLLRTYVSHPPRVWEGLFRTFAPEVADRIEMRNVDKIAHELYLEGDGTREVAQQDARTAIVHEVWAERSTRLGGLNELALQEEFD